MEFAAEFTTDVTLDTAEDTFDIILFKKLCACLN